MTATTRSVRAGDITLEIAEAGAGGRPLLMVHGFTGAKEDFADWWDRLAERGWHVVAPDLRGHGASDQPTDAADYSLDHLEADVIALVDDLGWETFVLLGHSMGGMVGQAIAIHHPERLDGLVLMDTVAGPVSGGGLTLFMFRAAGRLFGMKTMARFVRKPPPGSPESVRRLYAERPGYGASIEAKVLGTSPVMARTMMAELHRGGDRLDELRSVDLPVLVIAGEHDLPGFVAGSHAMADAIPGATLVVLDGAAHSPQFETPDAWWATLTEFLDALRAPAPRSAPPSASDLTVAEQAALTAGSDLWHTTGVERLGVAGIGVTDGPSGARGTTFTGAASTSLPCGTALASTWNRALVGRVGRLLGDEAAAKGASVLLAPTVNIHRHPLGGRNFESYSEDPYLSAEIAVAFVEGVQSRGVGCAVKHFVCNDQETDRMTIDVEVDDRALREIYLVPFEAAVRRAGAWAVMAAYNRVGGLHCSEHPGLLTDVLRDEWEFDGVVVSDWFGTHGPAALSAGLDLEMPGPAIALGHHLAAALESGAVTSAAVARAAQRVLDLIERTAPSRTGGAVGDASADADAALVARTAAIEAIVLVANDGVLPLDATAAPRIAVIGWRADQPEFQGGGSAQVTPPYVITPLEGISARASAGTVVFEAGRRVPSPATIGGRLLARADGAGGVVGVEYFAAGGLSGPPLRRDTMRETTAIWIGEPAPGVPAADFSARLRAAFTPDVSGTWTLSVAGAGVVRLFLDGEPLVGTPPVPSGAGPLGLLALQVETEVALEGDITYELVAEIDVAPSDGPIALAGITVEARPPARPHAVETAIRAAAAADIAIVVVGHDTPATEGQDIASLDLPPDQVELIRSVAATSPRTVVVVNAASPVTMDWAADVSAIVQMSYLGQETGAALAAVLFGDADASGRLTTTYPRRLEDCPAHANFPGRDGTVAYAEGILVGYRHYDARGVEPRWCFGHGLSYTTFAFSPVSVERLAAGGDGRVAVTLDVTNTGTRAGSEVVQVYVRAVDAAILRPDRELKAFEKVTLEPGEAKTVCVTLDERAFAYWDAEVGDWHVALEAYEILIGTSSRAIHQTVRVDLNASPR